VDRPLAGSVYCVCGSPAHFVAYGVCRNFTIKELSFSFEDSFKE
jgi:hypothetical protein